jgi:WD40 repeat protein
VLDIAASSDMLFLSTYDASIHAYSLNNLERLRTMRGHNWEIWQVHYVDGVLFSGSHDHTIKRWDPRTFQDTCTLKGHKVCSLLLQV